MSQLLCHWRWTTEKLTIWRQWIHRFVRRSYAIPGIQSVNAVTRVSALFSIWLPVTCLKKLYILTQFFSSSDQVIGSNESIASLLFWFWISSAIGEVFLQAFFNWIIKCYYSKVLFSKHRILFNYDWLPTFSPWSKCYFSGEYTVIQLGLNKLRMLLFLFVLNTLIILNQPVVKVWLLCPHEGFFLKFLITCPSE